MLKVLLVSFGSVVLLVVPSVAFSCYNFECGNTTNPEYDFKPCVEPFDPNAKIECNGTQCMTQWYFKWKISDSKNLTTSGIKRICPTKQLPISSLTDCVGLNEKYTEYKDLRFFTDDNQCCYNAGKTYTEASNIYTHCFCLKENCNNKVDKPEIDTSDAVFPEMMIVALSVATSLMSAKFTELH